MGAANRHGLAHRSEMRDYLFGQIRCENALLALPLKVGTGFSETLRAGNSI
jgi:hypothetical protein